MVLPTWDRSLHLSYNVAKNTNSVTLTFSTSARDRCMSASDLRYASSAFSDSRWDFSYCRLAFTRAKQQQHPFNGPLSGTTWVSQYQKSKTNLDNGARDSQWQWHQLGHMQICTSSQTDNHASIPPLSFFYRPDALPAAQLKAWKHWRYEQNIHTKNTLTVKLRYNGLA